MPAATRPPGRDRPQEPFSPTGHPCDNGCMRRRRRWWRARKLLLLFTLVLLLIALGRGLGLFATKGGGGSRADVANPPADHGTATPGADVAQAVVGAPAVEPAPERPPQPVMPVDLDRTGAQFSLIEHLLGNGEVARAAVLLERLEREAAPVVLAAAAHCRGDVLAAARRECAALVAELRGGAVFAARERLRRLVAGESAIVDRELDGAIRACGWPRLRNGGAGSGQAPPPEPRLRDRTVRTTLANGAVTARVVGADAGSVTLRVVDRAGVRFPTVPLVQCEVVDASAADAAELALCALHANDEPLARLWVCHALARCPGEPPARLATVRALLP